MGDQENDHFFAALQRLSPELQEKIQFLTENPPLPVWPEQTRGVPNLCLRSALFSVIQRGRRKAVKGEVLAAIKGLSIRYTGWRLDQGDFDVLVHALHLVSLQQQSSTDRYVQFTAKGFLRAIGRSSGKSGREWLKDSFRRLTASAVEIKIETPVGYKTEIFTYAGSLVEEFYYTDSDHRYFLKINPKFANLFDAGWTQLQWQQRLQLKTDLAKWLHGFYASHRTPYPLKVVTLKQLCGSDCGRLSDYRGKLRYALAELVDIQILASWIIDQDDRVHVHKQEAKLF
ncbi:MAG: Replication initiator protein A [Desulfobulbaceae bacterium]|nr:MAG: Replication initiator protein A [Desulfobulbaceae bacterium]